MDDREGRSIKRVEKETYRLDVDKEINAEQYPECKHMPYVFKMAGKYNGRFAGRIPGVEFSDLVHTGYLVLRKCHEKHRHEEEKPFLAYLRKGLKNAFQDLINKGICSISMPKPLHYKAHKFEKGQFVDGKGPTKRRNVEQAVRVRRMKASDIDNALNMAKVGLDLKWIDLEALRYGLRKLSEKDQKVICLRYGLDESFNFTGDERTYEEIGGLIDRTKQMANLIHNEAIGKLKELVA